MSNANYNVVSSTATERGMYIAARFQSPFYQNLLATFTMVRQSSSASSRKVQWSFPLRRENFILLAIGIATIVVGYMFMLTAITNDPAQHQQVWNNALAVTVAPILLVIGYAVIIPIALLYRSKKQ